MTSRFTVRRLAALVLAVVTSSAFFFWAVIVLVVVSSDDASDDNPEALLPELPAASATAPAPTPTAPIAEPTPSATAPPAATSEPPPASASGQGTPPPAAPTDYSELGPAYAAAEAALRAAGRETVDALLSGDAATPYARFSEAFAAELPRLELEAFLQELRGDRVHFGFRVASEADEARAIFDGRLSDGTISGDFAFVGQARGTFFLERSLPAEPAAPLVGQWAGVVAIGEAQLGITVDIEGEGEELTGTIDVPAQGLFQAVVEDVRYEAAVRVGTLLAESVVPFSPDLGVYTSEHAWGPSTLVLAVYLDGNGTILNLDQSWQAPLPLAPNPDFTSETEFRTPFDGLWWVSRGGPREIQNHHVVAPSQFHGYDIIIWKDGAAYRGDGSANEDYWAWGQPALAPADGTIVAVLDGLEDNTPGVTKPEPHPAGNHVILQTGTAEFLFIAHLQQGSVRVREGEHVTAGAVLGLTGNSGNSFGPHIHIHLQDEQDFFSRTATGLPLPFIDSSVNGEPAAANTPVQGQFIGPAAQDTTTS